MSEFLTTFYSIAGRFLGLLFTMEITPGISLGLISISFVVIKIAWKYLVRIESANANAEKMKSKKAD